MKAHLLKGLFILLFFSSCLRDQEGISVVDSNKFEQQMKESSSQIVDVRTPEEFEEGHITNAVNMNVTGDDFEKQIESLDKEKPVMVYCKSGGRSARAASILKDKGFKNVYDLDGGIIGWSKANKPIEN